jgi:hypothetical protein
LLAQYGGDFHIFVLIYFYIILHILHFPRLLYTALYFSIFVLDANSALVGLSNCYAKFSGTTLGASLGANSIKCNTSVYSGVIVIDMIQVFTFYFLYECWSMTDNLYSDKGQSNHGAKPYVRGKQDDDEKRRYHQDGDSVKNPLQNMDDGMGQRELGPQDSLDSHFDAMVPMQEVPSTPPPPPPQEKSFCFLL